MRDLKFENNGCGGVEWLGYDELVASFEVDTLLQVDDNDYQGDSRYLLRDGDRYGLLIFGWGSCSGCDALQACEDNLAEITELRDQLWNDVHWEPSLDAMLRYITEKGWELEFSWHAPETKDFVRRATELLSSPTTPSCVEG